jgi:hypothetical protein
VGVTTTGVGVATAAVGLRRGAEGEVNLQRGVRITEITVDDSGDQDANFEYISDDNTNFQAAVELNRKDRIRFTATVQNTVTDRLDVRVQIDPPDVIDTAVGTGRTPADEATTGTDDGRNTANNSNNVGETDTRTYIATLEYNPNKNAIDKVIHIDLALADTAPPRAYIIDIAIDPVYRDPFSLPWRSILNPKQFV